MKIRDLKFLFLSFACLAMWAIQSCQDVDDLQQQADLLEQRIGALEKATDEMNQSVAGLQYLLAGKQVVGITSIDNGYRLELSDGKSYDFVVSENPDGLIPLLGINEEGYWTYQVNESAKPQLMKGPDGKPVKAYPTGENGKPAYELKMQISADGFWMVSFDGGKSFEYLKEGDQKVSALADLELGAGSIFSQILYRESEQKIVLTLKADGKRYEFPVIETFYLKILEAEGEQVFALSQNRVYPVEQREVKEAMIQAPDGWKVALEDTRLSVTAPARNATVQQQEIKIVITSAENYVRCVALPTKLLNSRYPEGTSQTFMEFVTKHANNVLLDFSYAGYEHGEKEPPSVEALMAQGYKVYDVTKYGAVANDGKSDREAFFAALKAAGAKMTQPKPDITRFTAPNNQLNAIIYFPEGEFVLQENEKEVNKCIHLTMGNFVIRGAGRNKTSLYMKVKNEPARPDQMWSTPTLIEIKHYADASTIAEVTGDAPKGGFTVEVSSTAGIKAGQWVRLYLKNNNLELVNKEVAPYSVKDLNADVDIKKNGVVVMDYHQVKSVNGNRVTFYEPLMHEVEAKWNWKIQKFPHYENIGIEDIAFKGEAKDKFQHHETAADDSGFKLIDYGRLTNSWIRRVNFISVSEAASVVNSANVSAYDIEISGRRGHSAIRSQGSSRVFIGKVYDHSYGYELLNAGGNTLGTTILQNAGQYHACGVSKHSLGAVIWNVHWGDDSCFESHATQPRATLIDRCTGGFMQWREGGDLYQLPNHLNDLTIWNMNATRTKKSDNDPFLWWDPNNIWWKNLPPVIVGFHGEAVNFRNNPKQMKRLESNGKAVFPESLYEAQLIERLGYVPAWLVALK